ncbi:dynein light chain Tctex-type 5-like isoform X1 [Osmerus eperlanus]|uniref:dynein light chain Tctex-type 5-like isoform X1 n=1 Tax=Osmerus eperlanus TaxID=29151 RepID=UPI002E14A384
MDRSRERKSSNTAIKEVSQRAPALLRRTSRLAHSQTQGQSQAQSLFSLKGLVAAQKFSKGLRERAALKLAERKATMRKTTIIVQEQIPDGSAQPAEHFPYTVISSMIQDFLSSRLEGLPYNAPCSGTLAKVLSEEVKDLVRTMCPARYKLVCTVALGQSGLDGQQGDRGLLLASRCLWDPHTDTCVSHTFRNQEMFCTIDVFAVYFE